MATTRFIDTCSGRPAKRARVEPLDPTEDDLKWFKDNAATPDLKEYTSKLMRFKGGYEVAITFLQDDKSIKVLNELYNKDYDYVDGFSQPGMPTPLWCAAKKGSLKVVDWLLRHRADPNKQTGTWGTPVHAAAIGNNLVVLMRLVENGASINDVNYFGEKPIMTAAEYGHLNVVKYLHSQGADVNEENLKDSRTPLIYAAMAGHLEVVQGLIGLGADVNKATRSGKTPLIGAVENKKHDVVKWLVEEVGANVNIADAYGKTPLFLACELGNIESARILVANRADVNKARASGETPLYIAAKKGDIDIVKLLVENRADVDQKVTWNDKTPRDAAREAGHIAVVEWLVKYEEKRALKEIRALGLSNRVAHNRDRTMTMPVLHNDVMDIIHQNLFSKK